MLDNKTIRWCAPCLATQDRVAVQCQVCFGKARLQVMDRACVFGHWGVECQFVTCACWLCAR